jgi:hypothetical protein
MVNYFQHPSVALCCPALGLLYEAYSGDPVLVNRGCVPDIPDTSYHLILLIISEALPLVLSNLLLNSRSAIQMQDGLEGACHVGGCGKEFGQAWVGFQLPPELFPKVISGPAAVRVLTGKYSPCVHGPVLP